MRSTTRSLFVLLFASAIVGCNSSPPGGVTGTTESFTITAPVLPVAMKQGEKQIVSVSLNRDANFKQDIALTVEAPKGLKVELPNSTLGKQTVKASDPKDLSITITADKEVSPGDHIVKVIGTPEHGNATFKDIKVMVTQVPH